MFSADDYFYVDGEYRFDATKLKHAQSECRNKTEEVMKCGLDVAVANTFTRYWEMKPYFDLAEKYGYVVHTIIVENRHGNKSVHNVPDDKVSEIESRFEIQLNVK